MGRPFVGVSVEPAADVPRKGDGIPVGTVADRSCDRWWERGGGPGSAAASAAAAAAAGG